MSLITPDSTAQVRVARVSGPLLLSGASIRRTTMFLAGRKTFRGKLARGPKPDCYRDVCNSSISKHKPYLRDQNNLVFFNLCITEGSLIITLAIQLPCLETGQGENLCHLHKLCKIIMQSQSNESPVSEFRDKEDATFFRIGRMFKLRGFLFYDVLHHWVVSKANRARPGASPKQPVREDRCRLPRANMLKFSASEWTPQMVLLRRFNGVSNIMLP